MKQPPSSIRGKATDTGRGRSRARASRITKTGQTSTKFSQKKTSRTPGSGRPRANLAQRILADSSAHRNKMERLVAQQINHDTPGIMAWEAACLLLAIERGTDNTAIQCRPIFN